MPSPRTKEILVFLNYSAVGGVGFLVDASTVHLLVYLAMMDPYISRVLSYLLAATVTWYLNRKYTFFSTSKNNKREWLYYLAGNSLGGGINYLCYAIIVYYYKDLSYVLLVAVSTGSTIGLAVNYAINKYFVFTRT